MWRRFFWSIFGETIRAEFTRWLITLPPEQKENALRITEALKDWMMTSNSSRTRALAHVLFGDE